MSYNWRLKTAFEEITYNIRMSNAFLCGSWKWLTELRLSSPKEILSEPVYKENLILNADSAKQSQVSSSIHVKARIKINQALYGILNFWSSAYFLSFLAAVTEWQLSLIAVGK